MLRLVLLIAAGLLLPRFAFADSEAIRIGVSTALTGPSATYGLDVRDGLLFANAKLAQGKYEFIFEDDKCVNREAVGIAHKFVDLDKLKYVIGLACSGTAIAATPLYEKGRVVTILPLTSSPRLPRVTNAGEFIFRTFPNMKTGTELLAHYIEKRHAMFGILSEETDYAQDLKRLLLEAVRDNAPLKTSVEDFVPDTVDFTPLLERLRGHSVDGLLINTQTEASFHAILRRVREAKWNLPLYGVFWPGSPSLLSKAREELEGVVYIDTPDLDDILSDEALPIYEEYKAQYGKPRSIEATFATTFEAFRALSTAIESGQDVRKYLNENRFSGLFGPYRFDANGEIVGITLVLKVIREGTPLAVNSSSKNSSSAASD